MWKLIVLSIVQCFFLAGGQVLLKLAISNVSKFRFNMVFVGEVLSNWYYLLASGASMTVASLLWLYMIKNFEFSIAYPITGISYIFGMLAAMFIFQEAIPMTRWIGVVFIVLGVMFIAK